MSAATILLSYQIAEAKEQHVAIEQKMHAAQARLINLAGQQRRLREELSGFQGRRTRLLEAVATGDEKARRKLDVLEADIHETEIRLEGVESLIRNTTAESDSLGAQARELGMEISKVTREAELDKSIHQLETACQHVRRLVPDLALALGDLARVEKEISSRFDADGRRRAAPIVRALFDALWDRNSKAMAAESVFGSTVPVQLTIVPTRRA